MNCNSENITSRYFIKIFIEFQNQKQILIPFVGYRTFLFKFYRKELLVFKKNFPCHLYWIIWNQSLARPCYWCINLSCQLQNFLIQKSNNGNLSFYVYILCISFIYIIKTSGQFIYHMMGFIFPVNFLSSVKSFYVLEF